MKKLQLVLNIVLGLAVVVLFVLYFTGIGRTGGSQSGDNTITPKAGDDKIYYVDIDTVLTKYNMAIDLTDELKKKVTSSQATLQSKQSDYEKEVTDYQYKVNRGLVTRADQQNIEQTLYAKQQDLLQLQQDLNNEINEKNSVMNNQVMNAITEYLDNNYSQYNCNYILASSFGGNVLYANDSLNISAEVIKGLNDEYAESKKKK